MPFITFEQARGAYRRAGGSRSVEESIIKAARAPRFETFDIFLSHSYEDRELIGGVSRLIEEAGLSVYVDWIEESDELARDSVTPETAGRLRTRMQNSKFLVYASSKASPKSKWMPWELGYFDGLHTSHIGILPLVPSAATPFVGQEYLGLYPKFELLNFTQEGLQIGTRTGPSEGRTLKEAACG